MAEKPKNERVKLTLELSNDLNTRLEQLATDVDGSKSEVLRRAIALFEVANEARQTGRKLGIIDSEDRVLTRIVGV